jgi:hypothetical protein
MEDILVPIGFFAMIAALFIVPRYFKSKEREALQATVRTAIERGQNLSPDTVEAITRDLKPVASTTRDLRSAVVWIAIAIGFCIFAYTVSWEEGDAFYPMLGFASIPALVGVCYLAMAAINASAAKRKSH